MAYLPLASEDSHESDRDYPVVVVHNLSTGEGPVNSTGSFSFQKLVDKNFPILYRKTHELHQQEHSRA